MRAIPLEQEVEALEDGRAYAELADVRLTLVSGSDAREWLHDLVTTDVASLGRFESRPSLLLTPTGRIRASFHVLALGERDFALAQGADQPEPVGEALGPFVLSSDVAVSGSRLRLFAMPGSDDPPERFGHAYRPSVLGGGYDLVVGASDAQVFEAVREELAREGLRAAGREAVEARRVRRGEAAFPQDLDAESLPAEAGLDVAPVTDRAKGCFLGQEAVAKVANLGHPTRVVLSVTADGPVRAGEDVLVGGTEAGRVTSAAGELAIVRVRWDVRNAALATASGAALRPR